MCLLIVKPPDGMLKRKELKGAFRINKDGAGFMFNYPLGGVRIYKGWFGFRRFYKAFRKTERAFPLSTFVLHMRIGTSGQIDVENCHPFRVNEHVGFAHNGVLNFLGDKVRSDTREFVEDTLCKLPDKFWEDQKILSAIDSCAVRSGSKFVMLFNDGSHHIFNESLGHWKDKCWYSNYSYRLCTTTTDSIGRFRVPFRENAKQELRSRRSSDSVSETENNTSFAGPNSRNELTCVCCLEKVNEEELGFCHNTLRICHSCLSVVLGNAELRCENCMQDILLTYPFLHGVAKETAICEYCGHNIHADDITWQLFDTPYNSKGLYE